MRTRSAMESARILSITRARWTFTVFSLMPSSAATCLLSSPRTTRREHLRLARGERPGAALQVGELGPLAPIPLLLGHRARHRLQQVLGGVRLGQKIHRPALHGAHAGGDVAVAGDEDDGDGLRRGHQRFLELEPVPARHLEIEQEAARLDREGMREELVGGGKGLDLIAGGAQEPAEDSSAPTRRRPRRIPCGGARSRAWRSSGGSHPSVSHRIGPWSNPRAGRVVTPQS